MNHYASLSVNAALQLIFSSFRRRQVWIALGAYAVGLAIIMLTLYLYWGLQSLLNARESSQYVIITPKIGLLNTFTNLKSSFDSADVVELAQQPFVRRVGAFVVNQFSAWMQGNQMLPLQTDLFFEAVPDAFLDVHPPEWNWREGDRYVPVIISKEFLNLYNFGYALAKGLPQLTPDLVSHAPALTVRLYGPKGSINVAMKVVGFSERIPSLLVPISFLNWANEKLSDKPEQAPTRLIVELKHSGDPALTAYLQQKGWEVSQSYLQAGRIGRMLVVGMSALGMVGASFMLMSLLVFVLSFQNQLLSRRREIHLVMQLGYEPRMLERYLLRDFLRLLLLIVLLTSILTGVAMYYLQHFLADYGLPLQETLPLGVAVVGLLLLLLTLLLGYWFIKKNVHHIVD